MLIYNYDIYSVILCFYLIISTNLSTGAVPRRDSVYGPGLGPIYLGQLSCSGTEERLVDCVSGSTDLCTHANDAGLVCNQSECNMLNTQQNNSFLM